MSEDMTSFNLVSGPKWIKKLWAELRKIRKKRSKELEEINKIVYGDPISLAEYYVEPDCQEVNPMDREDEDFLAAKEPLMRKIDQFIKKKNLNLGDHILFILSDAGMGKTSILIMLKLMHITSFWPRGHQCVLKKLSKSTLSEIQEIDNKRKTILLLDALDEDHSAFGRINEYLTELLLQTKEFYKVILTCRTQFFPRLERDRFERPGVVNISGYNCISKYISFFDEDKVETYLKKRFPKALGLFTPYGKIRKAKDVVSIMGSLRCRPMLLNYIEDLMDRDIETKNNSEYFVYWSLVKSWLDREKVKHQVPSEKLWNACAILATHMFEKGIRSISEIELDELIKEKAELKSVKSFEIKGRSLLNRNSDGDYRFSHYSIQEFFCYQSNK